MGRKSTYNAKDAAEIVERLSKGEPLAVICRDDWLPAYRTVYHWADENAEFAANIARAREAGFDQIAADCLAIADGRDKKDPVDFEASVADGTLIVRDHNRDRLRVDTRLKLLAKWDPKRYGDAVQVKHADANGEKLPVDEVAAVTRLSAIVAAVQARAHASDDAE